MKVIVVNESKKHIASNELARIVRRIRLQLLQMKLRNRAALEQKTEITIVFLDAKSMKNINMQFRKKNKPTDILSFSSEDPESLGELLLCLPVLQKQAKEHDLSFHSEITYMLVHGILHLLGYDHELSQREERLMFRLQDRCFAELEIR